MRLGSEAIIRKGFVMVYILILMIPVMLISLALLELVSTDYMSNINIEAKAQTFYNAETGIEDGVNSYKYIAYDGFRMSKYYLDLQNDKMQYTLSPPNDNDYVKVEVSYNNIKKNRVYSIKATGIYKGCIKDIEKTIIIELE